MTIHNDELEKLNAIIQKLEQDPSLAHTTAQVAKLADISLLRLKLIFKQHTGSTIQQFLTSAKMNKAALLLKDNNTTIKEISSALGYADLTSFYRSFSRYYNCTPLQYRQQHLQM
jgi:AraC-like DNA-binding protein